MNTNNYILNRIYSHESSRFLPSITFSWTYDIFRRGKKKDLDKKDLYKPLDDHASGLLGDKIAKLWDEQLTTGEPSLIKVILRCFKNDLIIIHLFQFLIDFTVRCAQPVFLGYVISYFIPGQTAMSTTELYWYIMGLICTSLICVLAYHPSGMLLTHLGMKIRIACCSLIYRKSLRLSKTALGKTTAGQVVNLLSNDVSRFDSCIINLTSIYMAPILAIFFSILLWREIGVSSLIGIALLCSLIPLELWMGKKTREYRIVTAKLTDDRITLMNEFLNGIQVIKMYVWEKLFTKLVDTARRKEMDIIGRTSKIKATVISLNIFTMRLTLLCTYCVYVLLGNELTAQKAFVVAGFYGAIKLSMTVMFPKGLTQLPELLVTIKRLQTFLLHSEIEITPAICHSPQRNNANSQHMDKSQESLQEEALIPLFNGGNVKGIKVNWNAFKTISDLNSQDQDLNINRNTMESSTKTLDKVDIIKNAIIFEDAFFKWVPNRSEYALKKITFYVKPGSLVAIVGSVGSGKSSLLYALLKELPVSSGSVTVNGKISYASQEPWLFNGTIRENILFGSKMDRDRYNTVISKCCLEKDLHSFPSGDKTFIGDGGIGLSGGQKSRINLARTVYRQADIYLLDDPLSAVDTRVSRKLFDNCITEFLEKKTRLLITHQLQYLEHVDHIIIIENGGVVSDGTYKYLQESGYDFSQLCTSQVEDSLENITSAVQTEEEPEIIYKTSSLQSLKMKPEERIPERSRSTSVDKAVYRSYAESSGSNFLIVICLMFMLICQVLVSATDYWVAYWVNLHETDIVASQNEKQSIVFNETEYSTLSSMINTFSTTENVSIQNTTDYLTTYTDKEIIHSNLAKLSQSEIIYIYLGLILSLVIVTLTRSYLFCWLTIRASIKLHNNMFKSVSHSIMRFFYTNPAGQVLNRFSKDIGCIDDILPILMLDVMQIFLQTAGILVVVMIVNYWLIIPIIFMTFIFAHLRKFYVKTSRSLKRLEATCRSPVFSHLTSTLKGMTTIRAFGNQKILVDEFDTYQDTHTSAFYLFLGSSRTFGLALDLVCWAFMVIVTLSFLIPGTETLGGNVGLAITQVIGLTMMFQFVMKQSTEMENHMTSVERVLEYNSLEQECPLETTTDDQIPTDWPQDGRIEMKNIFLKYSPIGNMALDNLSLMIHPKEKIGIIGRTGAGKTSIINALFRIGYLKGKIEIDGIDTENIGLFKLRSKLSIIPQEPMLLSGTLKKNLDPYREYNDDVLWEILQNVEMKSVVSDLPGGLDYIISEGGSNFSTGQRQLICLARALIKQNKIIILDEATASVDTRTDALIQLTIRDKFSDFTVITVAHRLQNIMDCDRVLLMDAGSVLEFDHAHILLQNINGYVYKMAKETGKATFESLSEIAQKSYEIKQARND